ncbi:MAG: hypothetical protein AAB382_12600 [Chloroflexota bacterium]
MTTLTVLTDPRARALSAVLAATDWPDREQHPLPRGVHPQAHALKKHVSAFHDHSAAAYVQTALNADANPAPLFAHALNDEPDLTAHLRDFTSAAALDAYWSEHEAGWAQSVAEVQKQVSNANIAAFLGELFDAVPDALVIHPNIAYPTTHSFGVSAPGRLYSIMPPRKAVGESKPWPFGDDRDYVVRLAVHDFCQSLLNDLLGRRPDLLPPGEHSDGLPPDFRAEHPTWQKQVIELFAYAAQIIFLNRLEDGAGDSFAVFERRTRKLGILTGVVGEVTNYVSGRGMSQQYTGIEVYLPHFVGEVNHLLAGAQQ